MSDVLEEAISDLRAFVTADGADIEVVEVNEIHKQMRLRLDLSNVECLECVIPPPMLASLIRQRIDRSGLDLEVVIEDPRDIEPT